MLHKVCKVSVIIHNLDGEIKFNLSYFRLTCKFRIIEGVVGFLKAQCLAHFVHLLYL